MITHYGLKIGKVGKIVFERSLLCSSRLHLFDQKYSKTIYCEILL